MEIFPLAPTISRNASSVLPTITDWEWPGERFVFDTGDTIEVESKADPQFHVRGATKIYRSACWRDIDD